jgi:hypothetical protein
LGLVKPIKDLVFQLEFNSLAHLVQKLTSYEQRHPKLYQDRFKRQVTLVDVEDAEDSGDDQEVAVAEWIRGAIPVSCKWVKQQGLAKGFDFDMSKVEQIFDLFLKKKQLKLPEGCKFPTAQELQGSYSTRAAREVILQMASFSHPQHQQLQRTPSTDPIGY